MGEVMVSGVHPQAKWLRPHSCGVKPGFISSTNLGWMSNAGRRSAVQYGRPKLHLHDLWRSMLVVCCTACLLVVVKAAAYASPTLRDLAVNMKGIEDCHAAEHSEKPSPTVSCLITLHFRHYVI